MKPSRFLIPLTATLLGTLVAGTAGAAQMLTRTLQDKPAIVLAAFGTSTRAQVTYDVLDRKVREAFPNLEVRWAFTSEIIRERVNRRRAEKGVAERLLSLQQVLADLEAAGYTKVAVQPLQIFPGEEYDEVMGIVEHFPGLKIETGETLLQRWETLHEVVAAVSRDFLPPEQGCNILVAHGTPTTDNSANITYLGLDRYLSRTYPNAFLGGVEGIVTREDAFAAARAYPVKRVRFIPFMYVAGDHIMNDVMGRERDPDSSSWKDEAQKAGLAVDVPTVDFEGKTYYKGLGFLPEVNEVFIREIGRALGRLL